MTEVAVHDEHGHEEHGDEEHGHGLSHATSTGISNEKVAMWAFLGSECLLFGALISTYILYRHRSVQGLVPHNLYDIPFTSVSSFVLLMSSLSMVLALNAIQRGDERRLRVWLATTATLGAIFISGQIYEFTSFIRKGMTIKTNVTSGAFYVLTGFHGVHVTIGIIMLLSLVNLSVRGKIPKERSEVIEIAGLYWHFVDIVWIIIFTVVYLIP
jgi:cytochrome c oxidase subunit 3/cytochrome o ubiquinol oxidase subunit 3